MKEPKIFINSSGILLYVECPVESEFYDEPASPSLNYQAQMEYQEALQASVKEGVEFSDQKETRKELFLSGQSNSLFDEEKKGMFTEGKFYSIPAGFSVEVKTMPKTTIHATHFKHSRGGKKYAVLVPVKSAVENSAHSFNEGMDIPKDVREIVDDQMKVVDIVFDQGYNKAIDDVVEKVGELYDTLKSDWPTVLSELHKLKK